MSAGKLDGIRACVFDAYGTLFDFASAARECRDVLDENVDKVTALWRDKQIQYTWLRAAQGRHADFWQVTGDALDFTLETLDLRQAGLRDRLMSLYLSLQPFPEVEDVLRRLKDKGLRTAILSNGSPQISCRSRLLTAPLNKYRRLAPTSARRLSRMLGCANTRSI